MSSFKRRAPAASSRCPRGCIPSPSNASLHILSTGIPSLDDVLGGGLAIGSNLTVLAPDDQSAWSKLIERYYIAQGLASGQDLIILGGSDEEQELRDLVKGCMWVDEATMTAQQQYAADGDSDAEGLEADDGNRTRIAWRYNKMKKFQTSVQGSAGGAGSSFSHALNLTTTLPSQIIHDAETSNRITYLTLGTESSSPSSSAGSSPFAPLGRMLNELREELTRRNVVAGGEDSKEETKDAVRVLVHDLGSLSWGESLTSQHIHRFNHSLRSIMRSSVGATMTTLPPHLCQGPPELYSLLGGGKGKAKEGGDEIKVAWLKSLGWGSDACVEFQGFAGDPALSASFPHSHGLVHIHSLPSPHSLISPSFKHSTLLGLSNGAGQNNLSFRLKRKRFIIETLHLGVEGGVGERRTEPVPGSGKKGRVRVEDAHDHSAQGHGHEGHGHGVEGVEAATTRVQGPTVRIGFDEETAARATGQLDEDVGRDGTEEGAPSTRNRGGRKKVAFVRHDKPELYEF